MAWALRPRALSIALLSWALLVAPSATAQMNELTDTEKKNVEKIIENLKALAKTAKQQVSDKKIPGKIRLGKHEVDAEETIAEYEAILKNIESKLNAGKIKSVPGLDDDKPKKKYVHGDPNSNKPSSPKAAYCDNQTWIWDGGKWVPCREGDIVVDKKFLDPPRSGGRSVDETTAPGWQDKWTLLHILVHEKAHEVMIEQQLKELKAQKWWQQLDTEKEKQKHVTRVREEASSAEKHAEVYEKQKNVLRLLWETLRRERDQAAKAKPPDRAKERQAADRMKWIDAEIARLEEAMKQAIKDHDFGFASCGWPEKFASGTAALYITSPPGYWRLDVDVDERGRASQFRVPETYFLGTLYREDPVPRPPSLFLLLSQTTFSGLPIQELSCRYLEWALETQRIEVLRKPPAFQPPFFEVPERGASPGTVGIVLPRDARAGETVSGCVVTEPKKYSEVPALRVVERQVPLDRTGDGRTLLTSLRVVLGDLRTEPAEDGFTYQVPAGASRIPVAVRRGPETPAVGPDPPVDSSKPGGLERPFQGPSDYETPPVCSAGATQVIRGSFDGDRTTTRISVSGRPAMVVAETPRAVYWQVPAEIPPGAHRVTLDEAGQRASFPLAVIRLDMSADRLDLMKGESTPFRAAISGLSGLTDASWRAGEASDLTDLTVLGRLAPEFRPPAPGQDGTILLTIENVSRDTVSIDGAANEVVVLPLDRASFANGQYEYRGVIRSKRSGRFSVNGLVVPFLAPVRGEAAP